MQCFCTSKITVVILSELYISGCPFILIVKMTLIEEGRGIGSDIKHFMHVFSILEYCFPVLVI